MKKNNFLFSLLALCLLAGFTARAEQDADQAVVYYSMEGNRLQVRFEDHAGRDAGGLVIPLEVIGQRLLRDYSEITSFSFFLRLESEEGQFTTKGVLDLRNGHFSADIPIGLSVAGDFSDSTHSDLQWNCVLSVSSRPYWALGGCFYGEMPVVSPSGFITLLREHDDHEMEVILGRDRDAVFPQRRFRIR